MDVPGRRARFQDKANDKRAKLPSAVKNGRLALQWRDLRVAELDCETVRATGTNGSYRVWDCRGGRDRGGTRRAKTSLRTFKPGVRGSDSDVRRVRMLDQHCRCFKAVDRDLHLLQSLLKTSEAESIHPRVLLRSRLIQFSKLSTGLRALRKVADPSRE